MNKQQRYDRQLRLWKEHGQKSLENAHICLLGGTVTGTESLKNLVLPGIKAFTIVDDQTVSEADLSKNFFLSQDQLGKKRCESLAHLLKELNEDVEALSVDESPIALLNRVNVPTAESQPHFFSQFSLVIASYLYLDEAALIKLERICRSLDIPLLVARSFGFIGMLRLSVPEYAVIETHNQAQVDLRIANPWPALFEYCMKYDIANMTQFEKGHIPYVVVLIQALKHIDDQQVENKRDALKSTIKTIMGDTRGSEPLENFDEASSQLYRALNAVPLPSNLKNLCSNEKCLNITSTSSSIWIKLAALKRFYEGDGVLPLVGTVPDMKATTGEFVALQTIYHDKAVEDRCRYRKLLDAILESIGRERETVTDDEVAVFCKNASQAQVFIYRLIEDELNNPRPEELSKFISSAPEAKWLIAFKSMDKFKETYKRYPGETDVEADVTRLKKICMSIFGPQVTGTSELDEQLYEVCRTSTAELHNTASLMGGIVGQECLKLITGQYVPANDTLIYDGIESTCWTLNQSK